MNALGFVALARAEIQTVSWRLLCCLLLSFSVVRS